MHKVHCLLIKCLTDQCGCDEDRAAEPDCFQASGWVWVSCCPLIRAGEMGGGRITPEPLPWIAGDRN